MGHEILAFGLLESWDIKACNGDCFSHDKYPKDQNNGLDLFYMFEEILMQEYEYAQDLEEERRRWEEQYYKEYYGE